MYMQSSNSQFSDACIKWNEVLNSSDPNKSFYATGSFEPNSGQ